MKRDATRILLEHPNRTRAFAYGEIRNISPTYKCHRKVVPRPTQLLADELYRLITLFQLNFKECSFLVKKQFGTGLGEQNFWHHFLDRDYGVGFNPRHDTMVKYRYLRKLLRDKEITLAKGRASAIIEASQETNHTRDEGSSSLPVIEKRPDGFTWKIKTISKPSPFSKTIRIKPRSVKKRKAIEYNDYHLNQVIKPTISR